LACGCRPEIALSPEAFVHHRIALQTSVDLSAGKNLPQNHVDISAIELHAERKAPISITSISRFFICSNVHQLYLGVKLENRGDWPNFKREVQPYAAVSLHGPEPHILRTAGIVQHFT